MLREYLVEGRSVRDLATARDVEPALVRAVLGRAGIKIAVDELRDPVCAAVGWLGYSFADYASRRATVSPDDQAKELLVPKSDLERLYRTLRDLALTESGDDAATR